MTEIKSDSIDNNSIPKRPVALLMKYGYRKIGDTRKTDGRWYVDLAPDKDWNTPCGCYSPGTAEVDEDGGVLEIVKHPLIPCGSRKEEEKEN